MPVFIKDSQYLVMRLISENRSKIKQSVVEEKIMPQDNRQRKKKAHYIQADIIGDVSPLSNHIDNLFDKPTLKPKVPNLAYPTPFELEFKKLIAFIRWDLILVKVTKKIIPK